jgi:hypothetical protein
VTSKTRRLHKRRTVWSKSRRPAVLPADVVAAVQAMADVLRVMAKSIGEALKTMSTAVLDAFEAGGEARMHELPMLDVPGIDVPRLKAMTPLSWPDLPSIEGRWPVVPSMPIAGPLEREESVVSGSGEGEGFETLADHHL